MQNRIYPGVRRGAMLVAVALCVAGMLPAIAAPGEEKPGASWGAGLAVCQGDCGEDGMVTVDELLTMINIALGTVVASACSAGDGNGDGQITVDEILTAVTRALFGCELVTPIPMPTPTPTPSSVPTPTATVDQTDLWTHDLLENNFGPNAGREIESVTLPSGKGFVMTIGADPMDPNFTGRVRVHVGNVAQPNGPGDWTHYDVVRNDVDGQIQIGYMALVGGRPSVAAAIFQQGWYYYRATTDVPLTPSDWSKTRILEEPFFNTFQQGAGLTDMGGNPALVTAPEGQPRVFIANGPDPQGPDDWSMHTLNLLGGGFPFITDVNAGVAGGRLGFGCQFSADGTNPIPVFAFATEEVPDEADDWVGYNLLPGGGMATTEVAVGEYNGRFVTCYATGNDTSATRETVVAMANSADPMTAGDWTRVVIDGPHGGTCDVIVYDGRLAVGYSDFRGYGDLTRRPLFVARALNTNPVNPSDWLIEQVDSFNYGGHLSLFVLGDKLNAIWSSSYNLEYFAGWRQAAY